MKFKPGDVCLVVNDFVHYNKRDLGAIVIVQKHINDPLCNRPWECEYQNSYGYLDQGAFHPDELYKIGVL